MNFCANDPVQSGGVCITAEKLCRDIIDKGHSRRILDRISLSVMPGELVAVIGGSGSGKSTLINCLNGFEPATSGRVYINGKDLMLNYNSFKSKIGYVPQADIVHDNLRVQNMLRFAARLRLGEDITDFEIDERVNNVLCTVGLAEHRSKLVKKLSGGQRKRASIAVELISDPALFFLDEPTSGLDPEAETSLMKQLCRLSHEKGKTVICITHTLQNISLFDKIIFLAPGGRLCFFGSLSEALSFFDVSSLTDAYELISKDPSRYVTAYEACCREATP